MHAYLGMVTTTSEGCGTQTMLSCQWFICLIICYTALEMMGFDTVCNILEVRGWYIFEYRAWQQCSSTWHDCNNWWVGMRSYIQPNYCMGYIIMIVSLYRTLLHDRALRTKRSLHMHYQMSNLQYVMQVIKWTLWESNKLKRPNVATIYKYYANSKGYTSSAC